MSLFNKIKTLVGSHDADSAKTTEPGDEFSPEALDSPPTYTFVNAMYEARQGNLKRIQDYLKFNKKYAHCKGWDDRTLLHEAVRFARKEVVQLLLTEGAAVNADHKGKTPLLFAVAGDPQEITNKNPERALDYRKRRKETVKLLIAHHADLKARNEAGETALHLAARLGYSELVEILLAYTDMVDHPIEATNTNTNAPNVSRTPLLLAVKYEKDKKTIQLLLEKGADPNRRDVDPGYAPLHYLAAYRPTNPLTIAETDLKELVELLLQYKADVNISTLDSDSQTALHLAINYHHPSIADVLLNHGADVHAKDANGMMAIGLAARRGDAEMVEYLLNKGTNMYQSRALFHAASCKHSDAVLKLLLEKRAIDVNMPDMNGYTPIFSAISAYSLTNVKLLIEKGIDVSQHSPRGLTVLEHAWACWGEVECVSGEEISEERRREADNAKSIIELLGGFDRPEKKYYI